MSYILDALRKAEAERERGTVPGIHTQPSFAETPAMPAPPRSRLWLAVGALGVLLVLVASFAGYLLIGRGPANPAETMASAAPANLPAPRPPTTTPPATPATNNPAAPVSPTSPVATAAAPAVMPTTPTPAPRPAPTARKALPAAPPAVAAAASVAKPTRDASSAAAPAPKAEERVYAVNELPDDIRRQLPALSVGGSMYSPTPANRLVIVNGQVLHEGERITADLAVQHIGPKSAVLVFKGYRYSLAF
jgi:general secretion pathway protein B